MSINWVMLASNGQIVRLPNERIIYTAGGRTRLDLFVTDSLRSQCTPFVRRSDTGTLYITTQRLIYLPTKPTEEFKSFATPILNVHDSHQVSAPLFGSWYWTGTVRPVSQGGIPPDIPRVELKLTFSDGGGNDFYNKFISIKERLQHARDVAESTGQLINVSDEPLPAYEARQAAPPEASASASASASTSAPAPADAAGNEGLAPTTTLGRSASASSQNTRAPDEPPPDYEEAQAQTISMKLEDHIREEAERR